jgi:methionyl aminopeptidase
MVHYKTSEEIEIIKESAQILGKAHAEVAKLIKPGAKTSDMDQVAEEFIRDHGGVPSFLGYNGFPYTLCVSPNEQVVHGFPSTKELQEGDILSIDCGVFYKGFHSDSAYTYPVGEIKAEHKQLLKVTKESLYKGIEEVVVGKRIGDISYAIQSYVEGYGYSVVRELVGHGLGKELHESPEVPNYGRRGSGPKLKEGMVIAIEPMINLGKKEIVQENDGWTIRTKDRAYSAHYEHTVALVDGKAEVLTTHKYIEEVFKF